ncbi:uncharacterized protein ColSpa_05490 [Colletotrichum spaethianum]|uniref:Uncharacterized protein n=1 Tax=Colletotrichum spaethianum TaxID=700344 RepID=A0AA37LDD6_9PEZI|nr:uncharacterized protein ColSpa_05490 [Colletotrichum spaethianum]GKT45309.1 hypothetical protein ColSpa_05490 [Colletotrichum spaethianum]
MICRSTGTLGVGVEADSVVSDDLRMGGKANDEEVLGPKGVADPEDAVEPKVEVDPKIVVDSEAVVDPKAVVDPEGVALEPPIEESDVTRVRRVEGAKVDPLAEEIELTDKSVGDGLAGPIVMGSR